MSFLGAVILFKQLVFLSLLMQTFNPQNRASKMSIMLYTIFELLILCVCIHGQKITLLKGKQEDPGTKCAHVVITGDSIVFKAEVDYNNDPTMKYVHIYIQKKTDRFPNVYNYNLQEECDIIVTVCRHTSAHFAEITITISATKEYSGARIYGKLITSKSEGINSKHMHFPEIYDISDIKSKVIVNGKELSTNIDYWVISVNVTDVNIVCACESQVSPCLIEISLNDATESVKGNLIAVFNTKVNKTHDVYVTVKFGSCRLNRAPITIGLKFETDRKPFTENLSTHPNINYSDLTRCQNELFLCVSATILNVLIIIISAYLCRNLRPSKYIQMCKILTSKHKNTDDNEPIESIPMIPVSQSNKYLKDYKCDKNPGHKSFYPTNEFTLKDIHKKYRSDDLYQLIKDMAELTVSVLVSFKSQDRPKKEDKATNDLSPNYYISETKGFRLKSGMIISINKFSDNDRSIKCPCSTCKMSNTPNLARGKVCVLTSSTVVYDNNEAEKSCFNLFYESHSKEAYTLYGNCISENNHNEGWCIVECATCDFELLDKLDDTINRCSSLMAGFNKDFNTHRKKSTFVCIVSHPHDFPKQISVGESKPREVVKSDDIIDYTRYLYTTSTCHGSAGAFVYLHGVSNISAKQFHVHLGVSNSSYNYCSIGKEIKM